MALDLVELVRQRVLLLQLADACSFRVIGAELPATAWLDGGKIAVLPRVGRRPQTVVVRDLQLRGLWFFGTAPLEQGGPFLAAFASRERCERFGVQA